MARALVIAVGLGVLGLGLSFWLLGEDLSTALRVPAGAYAVGILLAAVNYASGALRLVILARRADEQLGFMTALRAYALGLFTAALTPGSAGQAPAVALSLVKSGMSAAEAWILNVRVWILDLVFLAWSLPLSILILGRSTRVLSGARPVLVATLVFLAAAAMVAILLFRLRWLTAAAAWLTRLPLVRRRREVLLDFLERVEAANASLRPTPWPLRTALHLTTMSVYLTTYFTFFVVVAAIRPATSPLVAMASAQVPTVASSFFPTPGGTGLLEVGTASLMRASSSAPQRLSAAAAPEVEGEWTEGIGGARGTVAQRAAENAARRAQAGTAGAILAWRLLTYYLRLVVGFALGGTLIGNRRDT